MQRLAEIEVSADELGAARAGDVAARRVLFERVAPATLGIIRRLVRAEGPGRGPAAGHADRDVRAPATISAARRRSAPGCEDRGQPLPHGVPFALASRPRGARCVDRVERAVPVEAEGRDRRISSTWIARSARLAPLTRTVVWLYDVEGWSHEEIAQAFDRTVSFSKSQLARGHARLRDDLSAPAMPGLAPRSGVRSMDTDVRDADIAARLRRLDAAADTTAPFATTA